VTALHAFDRLRAQRLAEASKPFAARGATLKRCPNCLLADQYCLCQERQPIITRHEFVLLMHRNEVFKPSNSGRLIADIFPQNCHAFCWRRPSAPEGFDAVVRSGRCKPLLVFPERNKESARTVLASLDGEVKYCFIFLDGTWKQASRMFHLSAWLQDLDCLHLDALQPSQYLARKSHTAHGLATAEAAIHCLDLAGDDRQAQHLQHYFALFNRRYSNFRSGGREIEEVL